MDGGHEVRELARSPGAEEKVRSAGGMPTHADLFDAASLTRARIVAGSEAVRLLCTPMITNTAKFKADFSLAASFPTFHQRLDQVVSEWRARA